MELVEQTFVTSHSFSFSSYQVFDGDLSGIRIDQPQRILTLNPHSFYVAEQDHVFKEALEKADVLLPDGIGIVLASRFLYDQKIRRISGMDVFGYLLHQAALQKSPQMRRIFFLGSSPETLERIRKRIRREFPELQAGFFAPPYLDAFSEADTLDMLKSIRQFEPYILFVGMTAPKQEKWVHQNRHSITAPVTACIGVAFDYFAGTLQRPGMFWQNCGLEWLIRLLGEPARLWRRSFISAPIFLFRMIRLKWRI